MGRTVKLMCILGLSGAVVLGLGVWVRRGQGASPGENRKPDIAKPYVTCSGAHSRVGERSYFRITSSKKWSNLWLRHVGNGGERDSFNRIVVPSVNFEECMVVAVFQGKGENSNGVVAISITEVAEQIKVRFANESYQSGPEGTLVTTYGLFVIPRSSKHVVLEEDIVYPMGASPVWRERARFGKLAGE